MKFLRAFILVVRDPTRTDLIFTVITDPRILTRETFDVVIAKIEESAMNALTAGWSMGRSARSLFGERFEECWHKDLRDYRRELGLPPGGWRSPAPTVELPTLDKAHFLS
ncbi:MAG: hypothetical protein ABSF34_14060 [Verrucomicrobiota bacterium]